MKQFKMFMGYSCLGFSKVTFYVSRFFAIVSRVLYSGYLKFNQASSPATPPAE